MMANLALLVNVFFTLGIDVNLQALANVMRAAFPPRKELVKKALQEMKLLLMLMFSLLHLHLLKL